MKFKLLIYFALASGFLFAGCEKDNYDPPSSELEGRVVYNGEPIGVMSGQVELELWQPNAGYELFTKIPVMVAQDGSYSAVLFDGDYKLVVRSNDGPWLNNTDSIDVQVRGNTIMDLEVVPYYTIAAEEYTKSGNVIRGYFDVSKIAGDRAIEDLTFYLGETMILDQDNNAALKKLAGSKVELEEPNFVDIDLSVAGLADRDYVFARAGLKIAGVEDRIYTPVVKILLNPVVE